MNQTVASIVWPWRDHLATKAGPAKSGPSPKAAVIQAGVMAAIGALAYLWLGHRIMGGVVWSLAAVVLVSGLFIPSAFAAIERFGKRLGQWVGTGLTWGLLAPFYYVCFVPLHVLQKISGKDPLRRRFPTDEPSYWVPRSPVKDASQYRKQF